MIFVTVGTDLPFERLVRTVDAWASETMQTDVFAQIGRANWVPSYIPHTPFLTPPEFHRRFSQASIIVAHAGMGTILSALRYAKPILVMPRRAALGEQRNDHQLATAKHLLDLNKIHVAFDERELLLRLRQLDELKSQGHIGNYATPGLIAAIREFIQRGAVPRDLVMPNNKAVPSEAPHSAPSRSGPEISAA